MAVYKLVLAISLLVNLSNSSENIISIRNLGGAVFWEGGGPIDLKCIISEDRFSNVFWIKDNSTVWSLNDRFLVDLSPNHVVSQGVGRSKKNWVRLSIETAQRKHSGSYRCLAEDPLTNEQISSETLIHVKYVPKQHYPQCFIEGNVPVPRLTCLSEPGSPEVVLEWKVSSENQTDLLSQKIIENGMLKQVVDFRDVPPPGEPNVVTCLMFIEGYGALRSCDIDVSEMYNLNSSFNIRPSPTIDVSVGQTYNATCSTFLSSAHFMMTLQLPSRTPHQLRSSQIEDGVVVHIENITEEYNEAVISCQIGWGFLYGRTKHAHITVTQVINVTEAPLHETVGGSLAGASGTSQITSKRPTQKTKMLERLFDRVSSSSESPYTMEDDVSSPQDQIHHTKSDDTTRRADFRDYLFTSTTNTYRTSMETDEYVNPSTGQPSVSIISKIVSKGLQTVEHSSPSISTVASAVSPGRDHFSINSDVGTIYGTGDTYPSKDPGGRFTNYGDSSTEFESSSVFLGPEDNVRPDSPVEGGNYVKPSKFNTKYFYLIIAGAIVSILIIYLAFMCIFGCLSSKKAEKQGSNLDPVT